MNLFLSLKLHLVKQEITNNYYVWWDKNIPFVSALYPSSRMMRGTQFETARQNDVYSFTSLVVAAEIMAARKGELPQYLTSPKEAQRLWAKVRMEELQKESSFKDYMHDLLVRGQ